jgi:hypothetical protein
VGKFLKDFLADFYRHAIRADFSDHRVVTSAVSESGVSKSDPNKIRAMKTPNLWAERIWLTFATLLFLIPTIAIPVAWQVFMHEKWYMIVGVICFWLFCVYKFGMFSGLLRWTFAVKNLQK